MAPSSSKSPEAFRTISEAADALDLPQHVLRFWETRFTQIKPMKRSGGRRYYRPNDIALLKGIRHLLYVKGYTIKGVQRILQEQGLAFVADAPMEHASQGDRPAGPSLPAVPQPRQPAPKQDDPVRSALARTTPTMPGHAVPVPSVPQPAPPQAAIPQPASQSHWATPAAPVQRVSDSTARLSQSEVDLLAEALKVLMDCKAVLDGARSQSSHAGGEP